MKRLILAAMLATGMAGAAHADDALKSAIAGEHRAAANKARDAFRHPYETLTFFGIKPTMTVIELSPGGGWYTEILAPYLRERGQLYAADGGSARFKAKMESWASTAIPRSSTGPCRTASGRGSGSTIGAPRRGLSIRLRICTSSRSTRGRSPESGWISTTSSRRNSASGREFE